MIIEQRGDYGGFETRELIVEGHGPEVILLHGFADSADTWRLVLEQLRRRGQAARAVDLPGFGQASPLLDEPLLGQWDRFVADLLDQRGVAHESVLAGNSLGSALALRAAYRSDVPIGRIVGTAVPTAYTRLLRTMRGLNATIPIMGRLPVPDAVLTRTGQLFLGRALYGVRSARDIVVIERFRSQAPDRRSTVSLLQHAKRVTDAVVGSVDPASVRKPVTVVHGTRDVFIPLRAAERLHAELPDSRLVVLPRIGHCPQLDAPKRVAELIAVEAKGQPTSAE